MVARIRPQRRTLIWLVSLLALASALFVLTTSIQRAHGGPASAAQLASVLDRGGDDTKIWRSARECERAIALKRRLPRTPQSARVASWNIRWFPDNVLDPEQGPEAGTNLEWLSCALAWLDADVIAVQEFRTHERGRKLTRELLSRLDARSGGSWKLELDRCPGKDIESHVGFLYDSTRATLDHSQTIESMNPDWGCNADFDRGFARHFRFPGGLDAHLVALHLQWGTEERQITRRRRAYDRIGEIWANLQKVVVDPDVLFLGDFNTSGCDECYPTLSSPGEVAELHYKLNKRNPRFRLLDARPGCTEYDENLATPIDHIVAYAGMAEVPERAVVEVYGSCRALRCRALDRKNPFSSSLEELSDHCPIVLTLPDRDRD